MDAVVPWPIRALGHAIPLAAPDRRERGVGHELRGHGGAHRPTDHAPGGQVRNDRQAQPSFSRIDVGEAGHPLLIGSAGRGSALLQIGGYRVLETRSRIDRTLPARFSAGRARAAPAAGRGRSGPAAS